MPVILNGVKVELLELWQRQREPVGLQEPIFIYPKLVVLLDQLLIYLYFTGQFITEA